jgi:hypothetical protein
MLPVVPDGLPTELDASFDARRASPATGDIQARRKRPTRASIWVGLISVALLAAAGIVAMARSITDSNARSPAAVAPSAYGPALTSYENADARNSPTQAVMAPNMLSRRNRSSCTECGVVESIRQIEAPGDAGVQGPVNSRINRGGSGGESGGTVATGATTGLGYEIRVRLRDGSTTVFNQASPQTWRLGSQVVVVGPRKTPSN